MPLLRMNRQIDDLLIQGEGPKPRESENGSNRANGEIKSRKEPQQHASEARREPNRSLSASSMEDPCDASQTIQKRTPGGLIARGSAVKQKTLSRITIDSAKNSLSLLQESEGAQNESKGTGDTKPPFKPQADQGGGEEGESKEDASSKSDRAKLRKGKWMVEEEEYTSRTIQHFSTGLLTLPEGATLRSYLADKLNCDPMRITKKFTGACCLGKRVYNLRDRPMPSHVEIEMAKAEMNHLEKRFRMRVEHDQSGVPLARRQEMLLAERPTGVSASYPIQDAAAPWLQSFATPAAMSANKPSMPLFDGNLARGTPTNATNNNSWPFAGTLPSPAGQWPLQNSADAALSSPPTKTQSDQSLQALNSIIAQLAWAQAAATLTPALSQLAVANLQQQQLRVAFEEQLKAETSRMAVPEAAAGAAKPPTQNASNPNISPADQLRQGYELHLKSLQKLAPVQVKPVGSADSARLQATANQHASLPASMNPTSKTPNNPHSAADMQQSNATEIVFTSYPSAHQREADNDMKSKDDTPGNNSTETAGIKQASTDEEAGTILFGFLNSLRESYRSAIEVEVDTEAQISVVEKGENCGARATPSNSASGRTKKSKDPVAVVVSNGSHEKSGKDSSDTVKPQVDSKGENGTIQHAIPIIPIAASTLFQKAVAISGQRRPASVTDTSMSRSETSSGTSSQPNESSSSMDDYDSKSDNQDPSSSEESEKDYPVPQRSHGPPRKRHKACTNTSTLLRSERSSGASSQPNESSSSMDDSDNQDPSSSEESEKYSLVPQRSQGPPRKRHKACKKIQEFTTQNVLEHSKRMKFKLERPRKPGKY